MVDVIMGGKSFTQTLVLTCDCGQKASFQIVYTQNYDKVKYSEDIGKTWKSDFIIRKIKGQYLGKMTAKTEERYIKYISWDCPKCKKNLLI